MSSPVLSHFISLAAQDPANCKLHFCTIHSLPASTFSKLNPLSPPHFDQKLQSNLLRTAVAKETLIPCGKHLHPLETTVKGMETLSKDEMKLTFLSWLFRKMNPILMCCMLPHALCVWFCFCCFSPFLSLKQSVHSSSVGNSNIMFVKELNFWRNKVCCCKQQPTLCRFWCLQKPMKNKTNQILASLGSHVDLWFWHQWHWSITNKHFVEVELKLTQHEQFRTSIWHTCMHNLVNLVCHSVALLSAQGFEFIGQNEQVNCLRSLQVKQFVLWPMIQFSISSCFLTCTQRSSTWVPMQCWCCRKLDDAKKFNLCSFQWSFKWGLTPWCCPVVSRQQKTQKLLFDQNFCWLNSCNFLVWHSLLVFTHWCFWWVWWPKEESSDLRMNLSHCKISFSSKNFDVRINCFLRTCVKMVHWFNHFDSIVLKQMCHAHCDNIDVFGIMKMNNTRWKCCFILVADEFCSMQLWQWKHKARPSGTFLSTKEETCPEWKWNVCPLMNWSNEEMQSKKKQKRRRKKETILFLFSAIFQRTWHMSVCQICVMSVSEQPC